MNAGQHDNVIRHLFSPQAFSPPSHTMLYSRKKDIIYCEYAQLSIRACLSSCDGISDCFGECGTLKFVTVLPILCLTDRRTIEGNFAPLYLD